MQYKIKKVKGNLGYPVLSIALLVALSAVLYTSLPNKGKSIGKINDNGPYLMSIYQIKEQGIINNIEPDVSLGGVVSSENWDDAPSFSIAEISSKSKYEISKMDINLRFPCDSDFYEAATYFINGRVYLSLDVVREKLDSEFKPSLVENKGIYSLYRVDDAVYVNLNYIAKELELFPVFDSANNKLDIAYNDKSLGYSNVSVDTEIAKDAYIRFEDVCASGADSQRYNDVGLAKLRIMADYMGITNQKFYIALIMWYKNPAEGINNNLTENINLYNASFLYTIDCMVGNGGQIVLHGLTHQYGNSESSVGDEYGQSGPYSSDKDCRKRMAETKEMAKTLGFEDSIFEFPHYAATKKQLSISEEYFDIIYQQKQPVETSGYIEVSTKSGKAVYYIPTPADYVQSAYDKDGIIERLTTSAKAGQAVSLFFHPSLDFDFIQYSLDENRGLCVGYCDNSILQTIVKTVTSLGYNFENLDIWSAN